jgi:hypothetical protein
MEVRIPAFNLINHLSQCTSLISYNELIELLSYNLNDFTYGQMLDWMGSLPFRNMKDKRGVERKVCGLWELKRVLKIDGGMLGWLLLLKYGKTNILTRCLVIDGEV